MKITFNNQLMSIDEDVNLLQLVEQLTLNKSGVAIAVNRQVISNDRWENVTLEENDEITFFEAIAGG